MRNKAISILTASIVSGISLFYIIQPGIFNMLGYTIHQFMWNFGMKESTFIMTFDFTCALILFWIIYRLMNNILKNKG